jgi:hypothetical protein
MLLVINFTEGELATLARLLPSLSTRCKGIVISIMLTILCASGSRHNKPGALPHHRTPPARQTSGRRQPAAADPGTYASAEEMRAVKCSSSAALDISEPHAQNQLSLA